MPRDDVVRGAVLLCASEFVFALMNALIKQASVTLPTATILAERHWLAVIALLPLAIRRGYLDFSAVNLRFHFARSLIGLAAMWTSFYAVGHLPLAEAAVLKMTSPLFVPLIAAFWLGEAVGARIVWAVIIGFCGVLLILRPGSMSFTPVALIAVTSGALAALARVIIRRMSAGIAAGEIVFYYSVIGAIVTTPPALTTGVVPNTYEFGIVAILSLLGTGGQMLMTRAYACAPASVVGPFGYTGVAFAALLGWIAWQETPTPATFSGAALIVLAGWLVMRPRP